jgi:hypothetical protein
MIDHPTAEQLLRLQDQNLTKAESATLQAHLESCAVCSQQLRELRSFEHGLRRVEGGGPQSVLSPELASAFAANARRLLLRSRRPLTREQPLRLVAAAVVLGAATLFGWLLAPPGTPLLARLSIHNGDQVRGSAARHAAIQLELHYPRHVLLLELRENGTVRQLFPDPNPVLGSFGLTQPLPPARLRIPPDPLLDFDCPRSGRFAFLLLANPESLPAAPTVASVRAAFTASGSWLERTSAAVGAARPFGQARLLEE